MRWIRAALAVTVVALSCACSPGVAGTPVAELWDPCTIPSEAIAAAGVDPTIVDVRSVGREDNMWRYCTYRQDWFYLTIYSTSHSLTDLRTDPRAFEPLDQVVRGRAGITYRDASQPPGSTCYTSVATRFGAVEIEVQQAANAATVGDTCELSEAFADRLVESVPE